MVLTGRENRGNILWKVVIAILSIITVFIMIKIMMNKELIIDKLAYNFLVEIMRNDGLTAFMKIITKFSDTAFIIILAICLTIIFLKFVKVKRLAYLIPTNLIIITLINQILKLLFQRQRPVGYRLIEMGGYSFPSGHAMVSMAFYGLLVYIIYRLVDSKKIKYCLMGLNIVIIVLIGVSRVYLGVHYFSDVIVGYSLSIIYLMILIRVLNKEDFFPK